jgi:large subunit ribosomal protein L3
MKRYNFGGLPASHGTERKHRSRGSIASYARPRVTAVSPKRPPHGRHMGDDRVTTRNHALVRIDPKTTYC